MKELSIEEKAKAYDEALEQAKRWHKAFVMGHNYPATDIKVSYEIMFPELKEREDERIRKELIEFLKSASGGFLDTAIQCKTFGKWLTWFEKQGKQKSIDNTEPKFKVGDWITNGATKPAQISSIEDDMYYTHNGTIGGDIESMDKDYHLWTIADAKDGDVLSDGTTIFIFKDLLSDGSVISHCDYDTNSGESDVFCPLSMNLMCSKITPATKEQRNLLFQKMKEAGYEWDADKKELKKIEQKSAWSEDDEKMFDYALDMIEWYSGKNEDKSRLISDWFKSLKDRVQPQYEQSEEDVRNIQDIDSVLFYDKSLPEDTCMRLRNWLESLRPQNRWKPSDEQMKALSVINVTGCISYAGQGRELINLYNELKKLKGE